MTVKPAYLDCQRGLPNATVTQHHQLVQRHLPRHLGLNAYGIHLQDPNTEWEASICVNGMYDNSSRLWLFGSDQGKKLAASGFGQGQRGGFVKRI